jgi:hypothetical protein
MLIFCFIIYLCTICFDLKDHQVVLMNVYTRGY